MLRNVWNASSNAVKSITTWVAWSRVDNFISAKIFTSLSKLASTTLVRTYTLANIKLFMVLGEAAVGHIDRAPLE